jgi:hypothetical protein
MPSQVAARYKESYGGREDIQQVRGKLHKPPHILYPACNTTIELIANAEKTKRGNLTTAAATV